MPTMHTSLARRTLLALISSAALAGCTTVPAAPSLPAQSVVSVPSEQGSAGALMLMPRASGRYPAVILWPDITGLRPSFAQLARTIADAGYVVLVPNEFYRSVTLDGSEATAQPRLSFGEAMQRATPWRAAAGDEAVLADTKAFVAYLDTLPQVDTAAGVGSVGADIGGAHAFISARALPDRIKAVAAIHPLSVATTRDTSPHLFVSQSKARYLVEIAAADDAREPEDKGDLAHAFSTAGLQGEVLVIGAGHGYLVPDDPAFDAASAEATSERIIALLDATLK